MTEKMQSDIHDAWWVMNDCMLLKNFMSATHTHTTIALFY